MTTLAKVRYLKAALPKEHHSVTYFVEHALESIDALVEQQRKYNAAQAIYGERIVGSEVRVFNETVAQIKATLLRTLEKTAEDMSHKGDKNWQAHYRDGVE
ncbi:hypothetical protein [Paenibacillus pinistramenti]|uniref:hypothetical protein n=1 Tax=Paenibacillus pinistramenti TaxID=1768003 RepID=UPI001108BB5F|nr:hypothetical protein [Paenibacillus pinistramenti]